MNWDWTYRWQVIEVTTTTEHPLRTLWDKKYGHRPNLVAPMETRRRVVTKAWTRKSAERMARWRREFSSIGYPIHVRYEVKPTRLRLGDDD